MIQPNKDKDMNDFINNLKFLNLIGLWDIISCLILIAGTIFGIIYYKKSKRRIRPLNVYLSWRKNMHSFNKVLHIEIRNLDETPFVVSSSYFVPDKIKMHPKAHQDSISHEYEIKFRMNETDQLSQVTCILRHRDIALTYVPINDAQSNDLLDTLSKEKSVGTFHCLITEFKEKEKPKTYKYECLISNVEHYD